MARWEKQVVESKALMVQQTRQSVEPLEGSAEWAEKDMLYCTSEWTGFIQKEGRAGCVGTDDGRWVEEIGRVWGNSFPIASVFLS